MSKQSGMLKKSMFAGGVVLLGLNITGLPLSLKNPEIYQETETLFREDIREIPNVEERLRRLPGEQDRDYVYRINGIINKSVAHYWEESGKETYNLRVPVWENYLLFLARFVLPRVFDRYQFVDYHKALERGVGLCSQQAIIGTWVLNENGVAAELVGLDGHVVLQAKIDDTSWYIVDPDYGVVIPYDIETIEADPALVRPYYQEVEQNFRPDAAISLDNIVETYGREGNVHSENAVKGYVGWKKYYLEPVSYVAIWAIPLVMITPFVAGCLTSKKKGEKKLP